ncbi:RAMP superfamily CRISPR-associated protein [Oceanivirga salmonicida]|uniref:RAMP superfamily CRISPR-associated protein n=1 Tax=Oceanivirga salmonicida TaxID=1769291 RepID=UPI0012E1561D|nr:RAMP superfamily CRISPR-associated protein [Oceanivirga salmonicida]
MNDNKFGNFKNKYIIKGELEVLTALHIGSGIQDFERDSPFVRMSKEGSYYIPGSSFRGYLRMRLERFLSENNDYKFILKSNCKELTISDLEKLFGYTDTKNQLAGRVHVQDMFITKNENITTVKRDGIKIDRETGITKDGGKFDYDVITKGISFEFRLELENVEKYELELIEIGLKEIKSNDGDLIGGKLSRGIGRCRLKNVVIDYVDSNNKEMLKEYIFENKFREINNIKIEDIEIK